MGIEIERKFLVVGNLPENKKQVHIRQGYIDSSRGRLKISENFLLIINVKNDVTLCKLDVGSDSKSLLDSISHDEEGYLILSDINVARIRIKDNQGYLTIKGKPSSSGTPEFEYPLPWLFAIMFIRILTKGFIEKIRYHIEFNGKIWEVDDFIKPRNIKIAEIELNSPNEEILIPDWVGKEVTGNPAYYNSEIIKSII